MSDSDPDNLPTAPRRKRSFKGMLLMILTIPYWVEFCLDLIL